MLFLHPRPGKISQIHPQASERKIQNYLGRHCGKFVIYEALNVLPFSGRAADGGGGVVYIHEKSPGSHLQLPAVNSKCTICTLFFCYYVSSLRDEVLRESERDNREDQKRLSRSFNPGRPTTPLARSAAAAHLASMCVVHLQ